MDESPNMKLMSGFTENSISAAMYGAPKRREEEEEEEEEEVKLIEEVMRNEFV